ncbi:DsbA family oxidoreductase [Pedobacter sp. Du54]|uniref:DsbA family oxidoreductase n=1 Tax=Pedobacter anseongensis TaxID=3133439 RepID=UPI0030B2CD32
MKIEIWSDVMCPFCYIGKRHLEKAIETVPHREEIEIEWKSYQLNPEYQNTTNESLYAYLARAKGMTIEQAKQLTGNVVEMASKAGLELDFENSVPANSFDAHRLLHFAKAKGLQTEAEEALFHAHFIEGRDIANKETLSAIGHSLGLVKTEIDRVLAADDFAEAVQYDGYEAKQIGIRGVPYFVFDRKYALSGAQPIETFKAAIIQSFTEWKEARA